MAKDLAIILNNGSVNGAVATALAAQKYRPVFAPRRIAPVARRDGTRAAYDQQLAHFKPYREHSVPLDAGRPGVPASPAAQNAPDPRTSAPLGPQLLELLPLISAGVRFAVHYQASAIYLGLRVGPDGDELAQATEYVQIWNETDPTSLRPPRSRTRHAPCSNSTRGRSSTSASRSPSRSREPGAASKKAPTPAGPAEAAVPRASLHPGRQSRPPSRRSEIAWWSFERALPAGMFLFTHHASRITHHACENLPPVPPFPDRQIPYTPPRGRIRVVTPPKGFAWTRSIPSASRGV